ncbi:hypothetical protein IAD21_00573 [Abditibacteriota bacterium]|nr:hypothetical protein IAD21_00573 [Abditibacteriota bacterium]
MAKTTIEVTALKPFALGGSEHLPGKVKVPASAVENLVAKGFIEAPEQPAEEESTSGGNQAQVEFLQGELKRQENSFNSSWREAQDEIKSLKEQSATVTQERDMAQAELRESVETNHSLIETNQSLIATTEDLSKQVQEGLTDLATANGTITSQLAEIEKLKTDLTAAKKKTAS